MSSNPFAALDDSGDEAPPKSKAAPKKSNSKTIAPSSKPDPKSKPKNNDRNTKHGRGGRPPARDGKRTYDRRSGTGRGKEIKKGGGGARNWGSDKNEAKKMEGRINEDEDIAPAAEGEEVPADAPAEEEPAKEDNTMTYAEYVASKGKKEEVSLRETKNDFAGVAAAAQGEEESFMQMGGGKKKKDKKKKEVEKKTVDVGFRVAKPYAGGERSERRDSRGGRGDRRDGRGRGRGGKGGRGSGRGRGGAKKPQGFNAQDEAAFPSL